MHPPTLSLLIWTVVKRLAFGRNFLIDLERKIQRLPASSGEWRPETETI